MGLSRPHVARALDIIQQALSYSLVRELGACPTLIFLLRRKICDHLRRARPEKLLNVFQLGVRHLTQRI
jgi:hypothetical protein